MFRCSSLRSRSGVTSLQIWSLHPPDWPCLSSLERVKHWEQDEKKSSFQDENYFSNFSSAPHYCKQTLETWESHQLCTFAIIFPWWNEIVIDIRPNLFLLFHDYYLLLFIPTLSMHIVIRYLKVKAFK